MLELSRPVDATAQPAAPQVVVATTDGRSGGYSYAPSDIFPRGDREHALCEKAARPDWVYLGGLVLLDGAAITVGSLHVLKYASVPEWRFVGPVAIGIAWGMTVGGAWLALPKCSPEWVGESPREGAVRANWPLALSLALLAGATAPVLQAIATGYDGNSGSGTTPTPSSTFEREMHVVTAALAGFGGALVPYLLPPRTWAAAREIDRLRFGADGRGGVFVGYEAPF